MRERVLTVGSLFSGIGGLDLGLERAGMKVIWQSEIEPYCCKVLAKHWPDVPNLGDVTKIEWSEVERPDLICGGFPCQPVSLAGNKRAQLDERWLWPHFLGAVRELRPRFVLVENVAGLLVRGVDEVLGDLASSGYDTEWESLPASSFGAPHIRDRVFIVGDRQTEAAGRPGSERRVLADASSDRQRLDQDDAYGQAQSQVVTVVERSRAAMANTDSTGRHGWSGVFGSTGRLEPANGGWWATEPDVGRVADGVPARVDRLRALGNAVVPQVAEFIGTQLLSHIHSERGVL